VTEILVPGFFGLCHRSLHFLAIETMERISLDITGADILPEKNMLKGLFDGRGTCPRRTRYGKNWML
jgi:hypothetical protein